MTPELRKLDDRTLVSAQVTPAEIAGLAQLGVSMLVNNRPDGEEPDQPPSAEIEAAAAAAGLAYRFIPVERGIGPAQAAAMREAIEEAGEGKLLAFCRSGTRSALTWALARRSAGAPAEALATCLTAAGFDPMPIAHLL